MLREIFIFFIDCCVLEIGAVLQLENIWNNSFFILKNILIDCIWSSKSKKIIRKHVKLEITIESNPSKDRLKSKSPFQKGSSLKWASWNPTSMYLNNIQKQPNVFDFISYFQSIIFTLFLWYSTYRQRISRSRILRLKSLMCNQIVSA